MARYEDLERFYVLRGPPVCCAYCGDASSCVDHTVPRSFVSEHSRAFSRKRFIKVRACEECNVLLGKEVFSTWEERIRFLRRKFEKKHKRHLRAARWDEDDMEEIGGTLRAVLENAEGKATWLRSRLVHMMGTRYPSIPNDLFGLGTAEAAMTDEAEAA